jgi:hypothetical protein
MKLRRSICSTGYVQTSAVCAAGLVMCLALVFPGNSGAETYLRNNIHAQEKGNDIHASYANWTDPGEGHILIPVNSAVDIKPSRRSLTIVVKETGKTIDFEYDKDRMAMSAEDYINVISSTSPVSVDKLSKIDRKGIADGKAYPGMSKDGVRIALGYPAAHRTPSLNGNSWTYWTNRFGNYTVEFDKSGKVTSIKR